MVAAKKRPPLKVGQIFEREFGGKTHRMRVVERGGKISYQVDGQLFRTPSAAARHVTNYEKNGWVFWHIERR